MPTPHPLPVPLVELIAQRFRVIGEPMRIRILDHLRDGPATVGGLQEALDTSQQNVSKHLGVLHQAGISTAEVEDMYRIMAIANYEDRFVIPTTHREYAENAFDLKGSCGFSFGNPGDDKADTKSLFGGKRRVIPIKETL